MTALPTEAAKSTTTIDSLPVEILTEVLLRVRTLANLVPAAATSRSWRGAIANPEFLARYRERHRSSPFLGLYIPRQLAGPPSFLMPDSICCAGKDDDSRHLKNAALMAFNLGGVHRDCRLLDCHNSRLLLTRGDEALEVLSPLARNSILVPFPPDVLQPDYLDASLLQGHGGSAAAAFRVVYLQHRREGRNRQVRAVEYDSTRKSWQEHLWHTIKGIEGPPGEVMHAGHLMFCRYRGRSQAALMLDTSKMEFSVIPLPTDVNFAIGEIEDGVCCLVEAVGRDLFKVWKLEEEKQEWKLDKEISLDQVFAKHVQYRVGYYIPRAISNGIALVCSTTLSHHFVLDLNNSSLMDMFEFQGRCAYIMQMPWPPAFSHPTAAGEFDRDGELPSVADSNTVPRELDEIEGLLGGASALAEEPMLVDTCQTRPEHSPSPSLGCCFSTEPVLSTGQVPTEFSVPKPDANMSEALEVAERMHKDGLNQESEVDGQKQDKENPPTRRVKDAKERRRERDRARWHAMSQEKRERKRQRDRTRWQAMSREQRERKRERDRARWHAMSQEKKERKRERDRARRHTMPAMNLGSSKENEPELRDGAAALINYLLSNEPQDFDIQDPTATVPKAPPTAPSVEPEEPLLRERSLNNDLMLQPLTLARCTQQGGKLGKGSHEAMMDQGRRRKMPNPKYLGAEWLIDDDCWEQ